MIRKRPLKIKRMKILDERWLLGNPIVEVDVFGKGGYKSIINRLSYSEYDIVLLKEYNKKIVKYCEKKNITVEDELEYLPSYFEDKFRKRFKDFGPLDLGMVFDLEDARLAEKIVMRIAPVCKFLSLPDYPRTRRVSDRVMRENGLKVNIENSLDKIEKKCDIILDVGTLEIRAGNIAKGIIENG